MSNSKNPRYTKAMRTSKKALAAIDGAIQFLTNSVLDENTPYAAEMAAYDATLLLEAAGKRVNAELKTVTKECGVGRYQPYGRKFVRRW